MYVWMDVKHGQPEMSRCLGSKPLMIVLRRIEGVCWRNRVTNEEVATSGGVRCGDKETGGIMEIQIG